MVTSGAKAITDRDLGPESEMRRSEIGVGLPEGQIEIEIRTRTTTEIAQEILEELETVRDMVGETMTAAEVEIAIAAPKVCIVHCLGRHVGDTHKIQGILHHDQITLAEGRDRAHQFVTVPGHRLVPDLLVDREQSAIDRRTVRRSKMNTRMPPPQNRSSPNQPSYGLKKPPPMATKTLCQLKMTKMLSLGR